jgi:MHS family proline/betaine transporter-like MFS transporter
MSLPGRVLAGMSGNILEWYDFALYSTFAGLFGRLFFPAMDPISALLASFGVFASGYLMRPLGALVFGRLADRRGRSQSLLVSLVSIAVPTVLIGLLPVHSQIGAWSLGGESTTSLAWVVEQAPETRRGLYGSWHAVGGLAGFVLGTGAGALVALLPPEAFSSWGWRLPFLSAGVLGWVAWTLRRRWQSESPALQQDTHLGWLLWQNRRAMFTVAGINAVGAVGFYLLSTYLVSELNMLMSLPMRTVLFISSAVLVLLMVVVPVAGYLSDRWGRRRLLLLSIAAIIVLGQAAFSLTQSSSAGTVLVGQMLMAVMLGISGGVTPALMVELTSATERCTTLGFGHNVSSAVLGGLTPLMATLLVQRTGNVLSPVWLWQGAAVISMMALLSRPPRQS